MCVNININRIKNINIIQNKISDQIHGMNFIAVNNSRNYLLDKMNGMKFKPREKNLAKSKNPHRISNHKF